MIAEVDADGDGLVGFEGKKVQVHGKIQYMVKPLLNDHCHEKPPVLKDHVCLTGRSCTLI